MDYKFLNELVFSVLNRKCACNTTDIVVDQCPSVRGGSWHTWRRVNKNGELAYRLATCFVGNGEQEYYKGVLCVNIETIDKANELRKAGEKIGLECSIDQGDGNPKRVWVETKKLKTLSKIQEKFLKDLIKSGMGAF